ncbi:MAG: hypothetical protein MZV63_62875 [Marinilabiliales bacterium]|nr:hypothetical protein [Marinilabiliales bacterium]
MHIPGSPPILTGLLATIAVALLSIRLRIGAFLRRTGISVRERAVPDGKLAGMLLLPLLMLTVLTSCTDRIHIRLGN